MKFTDRLRLSAVIVVVVLALPASPAQTRLANVSTLTRVGTGDDVLTAGFVVAGTTTKQVIIRAVGPTLSAAPFGVPGALADPILTIFDATGTIVAANDNWTATDAPAFASVGAFALGAGSRDAAVVTSLPPGAYSAQVSGAGGSTGTAIVEIYEVGTAGSRFVNLSTRAQVGGAAGVLTPGFVVSPGTGTRKLLIRAAGPALAALGVSGVLSDPTLTLLRSGSPNTTVATNDNWETPADPAAATASLLTTAFSQAGAFSFPTASRDAALLVDLTAGNYVVQVNGTAGSTGTAIVEVYDLTPIEPPTVTMTALKTNADESGGNNGEFVFLRTGPTFDTLTVRYGVSGSASNGIDFATLPGTVTIPAGASSVTLPLEPNPDVETEGSETVTITLLPGNDYVVGSSTTASVSIADRPATLYIAHLRPANAAAGSTASGIATLMLSADGRLASIQFTSTNLSSSVVSAHVQLGASGDFVLNLPYTSSGGAQWRFAPTGNYTSADLLEALKTGRILLGIDTSVFPQGEVRGAFLQGAGSRVFTPPPSPAPVPLTNLTAADAARLLVQGTFGPKKSEIDALTGGSVEAWLSQQLALPFTSHRAAFLEDHRLHGGLRDMTARDFNVMGHDNRYAAWWKTVLTAPDQLRQRVAFALSEIFVVSEFGLPNNFQSEPLTHYYDLLGNGAFGNFRRLLEDVSLSPIMGEYLSHLRNAKADPATGSTPDENYAREVMQLFTIGLHELQPDGTLVLADTGLPIPTYSQRTVTEMAKVFTGWAYASTRTDTGAFRSAAREMISPMQLYPAWHDETAKDLRPVANTALPAGHGGLKDLQMALDALFTHRNTAPFISRQLIQRLVTSNPSPGYVYRVAQKFANDGTGTRGNMAAVIRAIFTDHEARSSVVAGYPSFGKLREPILRMTAVLRGFNSRSDNGRYTGFFNTLNGQPYNGATTYPNNGVTALAQATTVVSKNTGLGQYPLFSPTVFNFFGPDYTLPGPLAAAGLVAPEFEITDDFYAVVVPQTIRNFIIATNNPTASFGPAIIVPDYSFEISLLTQPATLVEHLNLLLAAGHLGPDTRARIVTAMSSLPASTTTLQRVQTAVLLVVTAPETAVQR